MATKQRNEQTEMCACTFLTVTPDGSNESMAGVWITRGTTDELYVSADDAGAMKAELDTLRARVETLETAMNATITALRQRDGFFSIHAAMLENALKSRK